MNRHSIYLSLALCSSMLLSSCSVYMAATEKGTNINDIRQCKTRTCLIKNGASLISQKTNSQDVLVEETFEAQKPTGSAGRAVAHGALDVATLGLWEAVGTPTEMVVNRPNKYEFSVFYKANGEDIKVIRFVKG